VMAIVGYEADQVYRTTNGDVSVPIYYQYNHHYGVASFVRLWDSVARFLGPSPQCGGGLLWNVAPSRKHTQ